MVTSDSNRVPFLREVQDVKKLELEFIRHSGVRLKQGIEAKQRTTMGVGGAFEFFAEPQSMHELKSVLATTHRLGGPVHILGAGSGVLIDDAGVPGWTIALGREFRTIGNPDEGKITVGGGVSLITLSRELSDTGLSGLEFAGGIPATVGGAVATNASAHNYDMSGIVERVLCITPQGEEVQIKAADLKFGTRTAGLPQGYIIAFVELKLVQGKRGMSAGMRNDLLNERKKRDPSGHPSVGRVFRKHEGERHAGMYIDFCGLRGCAIGGARVSQIDPSWIINETKQATCDHVVRLINVCRQEVASKMGVKLDLDTELWVFGDKNSPMMII